MKRLRMQLVIALIVLVCFVSLIRVVQVVLDKQDTSIAPGVAISTSSPVATPVLSVSSGVELHRNTYGYAAPYNRHTIDNHSVSTPYVSGSTGVYLTSGAAVHSAGGGGNYVPNATSSASSSRGINYNGVATMPVTNFVALASSRQVAEPAAADAPQMAKMASGPYRAPGPPNPPGLLPEDHQLVEHPLGNILWPLLFMGLVYAVVIRLRCRRKA